LTADNKVIKEYNFENLSSGEHQFVWDGTDFKEQKAANGYYFFRILRKD
jgi:flagellar hook assembly protein FlgD